MKRQYEKLRTKIDKFASDHSGNHSEKSGQINAFYNGNTSSNDGHFSAKQCRKFKSKNEHHCLKSAYVGKSKQLWPGFPG